AHQDVFNILLQVLDEGRLTDNKGHTVNFKNTIIIMTSNLGAPLIMEKSQQITDSNREMIYQEIKGEILQLLQQSLRPEFLNRVDEVIVFHPLTKEDIKKIVDLQFRHIRKLLEDQYLSVELSEEAKELLAELGYDPSFGARPLKRVMQKMITNVLATRILAGDFGPGDHIVVVRRENSLDFEKKTH
ncbi:MAG TPA: hypothetical protein ENG82_06690, partial [Bacteroidetes bacterium]|nr:hypothetical protein [Bacteroidota bacterium]